MVIKPKIWQKEFLFHGSESVRFRRIVHQVGRQVGRQMDRQICVLIGRGQLYLFNRQMYRDKKAFQKNQFFQFLSLKTTTCGLRVGVYQVACQNSNIFRIHQEYINDSMRSWERRKGGGVFYAIHFLSTPSITNQSVPHPLGRLFRHFTRNVTTFI